MHGILTRRRRRFRLTTHSKHRHWIAPNLLKRQFKADKPNQVWVGDVTFVATRAGWLYLAVLLDLHSRRVVGWSMSERNDIALRMAITARRPAASVRPKIWAKLAFGRRLDCSGTVRTEVCQYSASCVAKRLS